jgi:signal transduction histidine kinase
MERSIVLPVKVVLILLLGYYLFFSNWFDDAYTFREAVLMTVRLFFVIYLVINVIVAVLLFGMDELPFEFVREVVLGISLVDTLFWAALTSVTGGFESTLYWVFIGLIIRNAMSLPVASTQIVMNLIVCLSFAAAGFMEVEMARAETDFPDESTEPVFLRMTVLLLMTACCYGVQVLFDKQRHVENEALEFAERQRQLQSAGKLAAEIAHQLKNPLGIINNAAYTLQRTVREGKTITQQIQIIREEVERSDRIITELVGYARLAEGRIEKLNVIEELDQAVGRVFPPAVNYPVRIRRDYASALPPLLMQRVHLSEILVNILQNAREATNGSGNIWLSARVADDYSVVIVIQDDGPGIPQEDLDRIFEPYFSTKLKGTGLGLAISRHNIELYGGTIAAGSSPGKGTAFTLKFPGRTVMKLRK